MWKDSHHSIFFIAQIQALRDNIVYFFLNSGPYDEAPRCMAGGVEEPLGRGDLVEACAEDGLLGLYGAGYDVAIGSDDTGATF